MTDFTSTLKELLEKATKGKWSRLSGAQPTVVIGPDRRQLFRCYQDTTGRNDPEANVRLICTLVNAAPEILEMVTRFRQVTEQADSMAHYYTNVDYHMHGRPQFIQEAFDLLERLGARNDA